METAIYKVSHIGDNHVHLISDPNNISNKTLFKAQVPGEVWFLREMNNPSRIKFKEKVTIGDIRSRAKLHWGPDVALYASIIHDGLDENMLPKSASVVEIEERRVVQCSL